jgi:acyl-CoA synthetase (AMP-forming)/AMP-acid ligase II/1-acyl-sn-glycerol-3-phosphate acyltransferase/acyl carrier protein
MATTPKPPETTSVEEQVLEIVRELLNELGSHRAAESVALHSLLERDLALGSLERVELLVRCEARFGIRLADQVAQQAETPAEWVQAIVHGGEGRASQTRYRIVQPGAAPPPPVQSKTLVEALRRQVEAVPERVHIHLLEEDGGQDISYHQLWIMATEVAAGLRASGLRRNDTVAIMLPTCADFYYAFFGVMLAGGTAVPIYPPARPDKIEEYVRRQIAILRNAEVHFLISFERVRAVAKIMRVSLPRLIDATTVDALRQAGGRGAKVSVEPAETAFIQYTSGSTGDPKGVVLAHANILANIQGIGWAVQVRPTDTGVSWLPLYHDMGLIGSWLFCLFYAVPITALSPLAFLSRPERWLWALHDSHGTLCPAPNFAYELCARKIPDSALEGLDLSNWRIAINAGEAVLPETLERFAKRFQPYGFHAESYVPCYGLAESTVALAFPPINRPPRIDTIQRDLFEQQGRAVPAEAGDPNALRFVANGRPLPGHEIRLVDDENRELGERIRGRAFFRGPSMTSGYFRNPEATDAMLSEDGWMDSGDLAYWAGGELHVTGRLKDCIIKSGRNIVPQEVEAAVAEVAGVRRGCVAAFGSADSSTGTERLIVVAETRSQDPQELERIEAEMINCVDAVLGIPPDHVVLVRPQTILKTSSGKIRRNATRALYERGKLVTRKRPPWLQIVRLWLGNFDSWTRLSAQRLGGRLGSAWTSVLTLVTALGGGLLARAIPSESAATGMIQTVSRWLLQMRGRRVVVQGAERIPRGRSAVLVAARNGPLDPLVLAAALPTCFRIADGAALESLPAAARFLLRPLVVGRLPGHEAPPGGTLCERMVEVLKKGHSVLVLAEGSLAAPPQLSRFRLDALHAAATVGCGVVPVALRSRLDLLDPRRAGRKEVVKVFAGDPMPPPSCDPRRMAEFRESVRGALGSLDASRGAS